MVGYCSLSLLDIDITISQHPNVQGNLLRWLHLGAEKPVHLNFARSEA